MGLDCNTEEGRKHIKKQDWILKVIEKNKKGVKCIPTEEQDCGFDAYIYKNKILSAVIEIKNRPYINRSKKTPATLKSLEQYGTYLITAEKLDILRKESRKNKCKSFVVVNLPNDSKILFFQITDWRGRFVMDFERKTTKTFYSSNNYKGKVDRENAFIPIKNNKYLTISNY